ncbi:hypothetical protein [Pedobacter aquatilis]|uniref:hypothetical protein n=1 Tax=Pedobacter aquatilis TaxID=351343 RepID=UPI00292DC94E|nr:hypothetical protein [Pedobacter aquatilis]
MENITGNLVLVHPELTSDPVNKQGQVGVIMSADVASDRIAVSFGNAKLGMYSADALMVLKDHNELLKLALTKVKEMSSETFGSLLRMSMDQESGNVSRMANALSLSKNSPELMSYSLLSLEDKLGLEESRDAALGQGNRLDVGR